MMAITDKNTSINGYIAEDPLLDHLPLHRSNLTKVCVSTSRVLWEVLWEKYTGLPEIKLKGYDPISEGDRKNNSRQETALLVAAYCLLQTYNFS